MLCVCVCVCVQADLMLVKNAQNLMKAVIKTVQAAEAACMKVSQLVYVQRRIVTGQRS